MNIAVVGLGFVGLSISSVLASKNYNVVGIDIDNQKCSDIRNGVLPLFEPELENTLRIGLKKKLTISNNFSSERPILVPLPPAITKPIKVKQRLTEMIA